MHSMVRDRGWERDCYEQMWKWEGQVGIIWVGDCVCMLFVSGVWVG